MKFKKKPVIIDATQWFRNGDHPEDFSDGNNDFGARVQEGLVVRSFRRPDVPGNTCCKHCDKTMHVHGWIDTLEGGHIVCPSDWIITGVRGEYYPCKDSIFKETYERVE